MEVDVPEKNVEKSKIEDANSNLKRSEEPIKLEIKPECHIYTDMHDERGSQSRFKNLVSQLRQELELEGESHAMETLF